MESAGNNLHTHLPQLSNFALLNLCSAHFLSRVFWLPGPKHRPPSALCLSAKSSHTTEWLHQQIGKITKEVWCRMRMGYILRPIQLPIVTLRIECTRLLSRAGRQPSCRWSSLCEDATTRKAIHVLCLIQEQRENGIYCSRAYTGSVRQSGAQDRQKRADPARSKLKIKFGVTGGLGLFKLWLSVAKPISQAKTHSKCQNPDVRVADSDIISATVISNGLPREIAEFKGFGQTDT
ncbi:hypothetical protein B0H13DRAFT_1887935 [Mycena leptocephala]|nr:hypothetical protein B0H13DRAFT_1887935 [Mycena leptocephala]